MESDHSQRIQAAVFKQRRPGPGDFVTGDSSPGHIDEGGDSLASVFDREAAIGHFGDQCRQDDFDGVAAMEAGMVVMLVYDGFQVDEAADNFIQVVFEVGEKFYQTAQYGFFKRVIDDYATLTGSKVFDELFGQVASVVFIVFGKVFVVLFHFPRRGAYVEGILSKYLLIRRDVWK